MKNTKLFVILILITGFVLIGCDSENLSDNPVSTQNKIKEGTNLNCEMNLSKFNPELQQELALVRSATARYHDIQNAIEDGYIDINYPLPNMGRHFLKGDLLDANFEVDKPEVLVYTEKANGDYQLVAVEYAVPVALSQDAPEGFTGNEDVWVINQDFQLWVVHAWVWYYNPDGMFNPTNPRVN